ncbi:MAG: Outer membrane lipoprotein Blc precursor [Deltaproteobacteria bacterium ADurb.BinA179]|jgi:apolipoprotein D and lipocalin family protein|nr:lipocalin family protein [Deltaproteobacteria bacterium]MDI9542275.1 lipocalin family protein [Pseudomonadota bacterium]NLW67732.1 lipocalin [Bacteriovoracaceae bacterium]OPZ29085.1 MAG: Outer membrane lipoprotein Blc precursor [Deltaproteobacteria bacterium ADurb.BinA179]HRR21348.1 lipocalin family protein [Desulfomonilia bacterium]
MRSAVFVLLISLASGCAGIPDGVEAVEDFDVRRYTGTWYEIARLENRFEKDLTAVTASYSLRDDGGIDVVNRGFNLRKKEWEQVRGKGYFVGDASLGRLKVTFFWPFYSGYNIIRLDRDNYRYALVCGTTRDYLWILARDPRLDQDILDGLVAHAKREGFDTQELVFVEHDQPAD